MTIKIRPDEEVKYKFNNFARYDDGEGCIFILEKKYADGYTIVENPAMATLEEIAIYADDDLEDGNYHNLVGKNADLLKYLRECLSEENAAKVFLHLFKNNFMQPY